MKRQNTNLAVFLDRAVQILMAALVNAHLCPAQSSDVGSDSLGHYENYPVGTIVAGLSKIVDRQAIQRSVFEFTDAAMVQVRTDLDPVISDGLLALPILSHRMYTMENVQCDPCAGLERWRNFVSAGGNQLSYIGSLPLHALEADDKTKLFVVGFSQIGGYGFDGHMRMIALTHHGDTVLSSIILADRAILALDGEHSLYSMLTGAGPWEILSVEEVMDSDFLGAIGESYKKIARLDVDGKVRRSMSVVQK